MSVRYAPLPSPRPAHDAERELDDAFGSDHGDVDDESVPLTHQRPHQEHQLPDDETTSLPGAYNFERGFEYDAPPPGSPPRPSAFAVPNSIGNSNGFLPTSPIRAPIPRQSFFRKAVGALLPTHYTQTHAESSNVRHRGGGIENDGVFANVMAKPQKANVVHTEDGEVLIVPEDTQDEIPPSYADAQSDSVPPYWETTVHAPAMHNLGSDMIIDDLPSGSIMAFAFNLIISYFFQFVGFLLTYLLHTSHAGKFGSRAGLGLTLIQYGFYSRSSQTAAAQEGFIAPDYGYAGFPSNATQMPGSSTPFPGQGLQVEPGNLSSRDWISYILMTLGWFLLLISTAGFWRIKHWESAIRSTNAGPITTEAIERDLVVRRNIENIFGISEPDPTAASPRNEDELEEARFTRQLAAAGLI